MEHEQITDPLVRVAYEKKTKMEERRSGVQLAERDLETALEGLELAKQDFAEAQRDFQAVMDVLTPQQQTDLCIAELTIHRQAVLNAKTKAAIPNVVGGMWQGAPLKGVRGIDFHYDGKNPMGLLSGDHLMNELEVRWKK